MGRRKSLSTPELLAHAWQLMQESREYLSDWRLRYDSQMRGQAEFLAQRGHGPRTVPIANGLLQLDSAERTFAAFSLVRQSRPLTGAECDDALIG